MIGVNIQNVFAVIVTLFTGIFTHYTIKTYLLRQKYKHIPGPPATGLIGFYLGNTPEFVKLKKEGKEFLEIFTTWAKTYGKTFKFQIINQIVVHTCDLDATREILIEHNFPKEKSLFTLLGYPFGLKFIPNGLFADLDNNHWKHRRSMFNPSFHKQVLYGLMDEFNLKGDMLLEKIEKKADGKTIISMLDEFNRATLDVIATVAFGMELDSINNPDSKINEYVTESLKGGFKYFTEQKFGFAIPFSNYFYKKKYRQVINFLRQIGKDQIESRLKSIKEGHYIPNDILTITLKSYENEAFDLEDMIDDFITFFIAGQETTAGSLAFCFIELARNPSVVKKLRQEIDTALGSRSNIKQEDLADLKYLNAVIKETLRLYAVAPVVNREVPTDHFQISSMNIPKGTWIQLSSFVNARLEDYFAEPELFKPERFLNENSSSNSIKTYSYFPFSLGPRNCIGQNFALIEMKVLITKLIKNFDFDLVPGQNLNVISFLTLRPVDGTKVTVIPRKI